MSEIIQARGIVLLAAPVGDNDKRLVIETKELGRITAFARGCRRPGSALMAAANPFVFGRFSLVPGREAYRLAQAEPENYFRELSAMYPEVYYGFCFLDLVNYYGREGIDGTDMLNLLYLSLKALMNESIDAKVVRCVFELRLFGINGEYYPEQEKTPERLYPIVRYILNTELLKLYSFTLSDELTAELEKYTKKIRNNVLDYEPKSYKILDDFTMKKKEEGKDTIQE